MVSSTAAVFRAAVGALKAIKKARETRQQVVRQQLQKFLLDGQQQALAAVIMSAQATEEKVGRRTVERAAGKWRGSTISGYMRGDNRTYMENFRCSKHRFNDLVSQLRHSGLDKASERANRVLRRGAARWQKANELRDAPDLHFKVAVCMYALGHGGPLKVLADVASIGESTLRKYLHIFAEAVISQIKPIYMPGKPFNAEELAAVQGQFASRRGLQNVTLACDGSHVPHKPKNKKVAMEYRNYKGWYSILTVAFVDSYYRFFDVHVGYPGRAGDNTVLSRMQFMDQLKAAPDHWLGKGGVVLGDSGASDGDNFFLNPYHHPTDPDKLWFNFCHSSTRFFVEQVFGMWKSRFRFLLTTMQGANHALATKLIYTSTILHNYLVTHAEDAVEIDTCNPSWSKFFDTFRAHRCPECTRAHKAHCVHQAAYRNNNMHVVRERQRPSTLRDLACERMWNEVQQSDELVHCVKEMQSRAQAGGWD
jgi:hypothetical protein